MEWRAAEDWGRSEYQLEKEIVNHFTHPLSWAFNDDQVDKTYMWQAAFTGDQWSTQSFVHPLVTPVEQTFEG